MRTMSAHHYQTGLRFQYEYERSAATSIAAKTTGRPTGNSGTVEVEDLVLVLVVVDVLVDMVGLVEEIADVEVEDWEDVEVLVVVDEVVEVDDDVVVIVDADPWNSNILLLPLSDTQRLPDESKTIPAGNLSPLWLVAVAPELKPG
jgi:hypothetical protein